MNKELATILKNRLVGIPFLDVIAGIVQPVIDLKFKEKDNSSIQRKLPVSYDVIGKGTNLGMERQLVPDQSKKSILYFEDFGSVPDTNARANTISLISNIRLVCWINKSKCSFEKYADVTAYAITSILERLMLPTGINENGIVKLFVRNPRIAKQDALIFSNYNYPEEVVQYLRPPFEYFAIDLTCKFTIAPKCLGGIRLSSEKEPVTVPIVIKDNPSNEKQTLTNGFYVQKEFPSGSTLTVPFLKGYTIIAPLILDRRIINGVEEQIPYDVATCTWNFADTSIQTLNDGEEVFINAVMPKVL